MQEMVQNPLVLLLSFQKFILEGANFYHISEDKHLLVFKITLQFLA